MNRLTPRECGKRCREAFGRLKQPEWGRFWLYQRRMGFANHLGMFTLYSDLHLNNHWWLDVPQEWRDESLVFLLKDGNTAKYAELTTQESKQLFDKLTPNAQRKINICLPATGGTPYFVEWPEFPLGSRLNPLPVSFE